MKPGQARSSHQMTRVILIAAVVIVIILYLIVMTFQSRFDDAASSAGGGGQHRGSDVRPIADVLRHPNQAPHKHDEHDEHRDDGHPPHAEDRAAPVDHHRRDGEEKAAVTRGFKSDTKEHQRLIKLAEAISARRQRAVAEAQEKQKQHDDEQHQHHHVSSPAPGAAVLTETEMKQQQQQQQVPATESAMRRSLFLLQQQRKQAHGNQSGGVLQSNNNNNNNASKLFPNTTDLDAYYREIRDKFDREHREWAKRITRHNERAIRNDEVVPGSIPAAWLKKVVHGGGHGGAAGEDGGSTDTVMDEAALIKHRHDADIVYTWVNGSEMVHKWKKSQVMGRMVEGANSRDRDSDELRHSVRSISQNLKWHDGRINIVSPGHVPYWLDLANPRVRVIHQDALILDEQERFTFNTNTIEQNLWRIPTLSDVFVQFNDDYFVMRDCSASVFFNDHGGMNLLYETGVVAGGMRNVKKMLRDGGKIWIAGVFHTHALMHAMLPRERRNFLRYIKHAPFTLCKSYLQALQTRAFPGVYHRAARSNRFRAHLDVLSPFIHNGFAFSSPDLLLNNRSLKRAQKHALDRAHNAEDRQDLQRMFLPFSDYDFEEDRRGDLPPCPPATFKTGHSADARLVVLKDDFKFNQEVITATVKGNYQFVALNDGFGNEKLVAPQLYRFIDTWFPNKSRFESNYVPPSRSAEHNDPELESNKHHTHEPPRWLVEEDMKTKQQQQQQEKQDTKDEKKEGGGDEQQQQQHGDAKDHLRSVHDHLDRGDYGVVLFASHCDGLCASIRSCTTVGFSRIKQRIDHSKPMPTPVPTPAPETTTTPPAANATEVAGGNMLPKGFVLTKPTHTPLPPLDPDVPGLPTFYVVPAFQAGQSRAERDAVVRDLHHCRCPLGSFQFVDAEDIDTVPRIFKFRNDTVFVEGGGGGSDAEANAAASGGGETTEHHQQQQNNGDDADQGDHQEKDNNKRHHAPDDCGVEAQQTKFATSMHAERNYRLVVRDAATLSRVVARARKLLPAPLPLMVLTSVDAVCGEAVTALHVRRLLTSDRAAALIDFTPLPSSVHPKIRARFMATEVKRSSVLLMPDHFRLSYLRTYPIPNSRAFEVPLQKFLRFFLLSYRTHSLGFNPNYVRPTQHPPQTSEQHHPQHNNNQNAGGGGGGGAHNAQQQQQQQHEQQHHGQQSHEFGTPKPKARRRPAPRATVASPPPPTPPTTTVHNVVHQDQNEGEPKHHDGDA